MTGPPLAHAFLDALAGPDVERLRALVAPNARFWINIGPVELSADERFAVLEVERGHLDTMRFDDVRVRPMSDGFVLQLTTTATTLDGDELAIPVCLVVTTREDRITRVDEYADSAPAAPLLEHVRRDRVVR